MHSVIDSAVVSAVLLWAVELHAASMAIQLRSTEVGPGSGLYNVEIQVWAMGSNEGIKGLQFDILSAGSGLAAPVLAIPPVAGKAKISWCSAVALAFLTIGPSRTDADARPPGFVPAYPADPDFDLDALGASFSDPFNGFAKVDLGIGGFVTVATEQWQLTNPNIGDYLNVYVFGAQYYDFTNGTYPSFASDYAPGDIVVAGVAIPEPTTWTLAILTIPVMACLLRRIVPAGLGPVESQMGRMV